MYKRLRQLKALTGAECQVLLSSMLILPAIGLVLRVKSNKWTKALRSKALLDQSGSPIVDNGQLEKALSVARMASIAENHGLYYASCLKKSLAIGWLLQRRGIAIDLKIGMNKSISEFNAHAWTECRGTALIDKANIGGRFSAFKSY